MVQGVQIVDGCLVDVDPATGYTIERVRVSTDAEVAAAIAAAKAAQPAWHAVPLNERVAALKAAVKKGLADQAVVAALITREMGKCIGEAETEAEGAANKDALLDLIEAANAPVTKGACTIVRDPLGVVAICSPWNYPVDELLLLALPALAAGNAVVCKPSEVAPLCGARSAGALAAALPAGLVGLVQGDGGVGRRLVEDPDVDMVAMTGSSAVGSSIMKAASGQLKRIVLELGGSKRCERRPPPIRSRRPILIRGPRAAHRPPRYDCDVPEADGSRPPTAQRTR